jgi:DNA-binding winged helix-turn-helix (wHTH) protein
MLGGETMIKSCPKWGGAMSEPRKTIGSMHFGPFELSNESNELRKHGQRLKLSGQAIDVLLMLASNAGRLVTREELQRKLWPGDSFGDFEHGLNAAVNRLREALGDSAADPTYIETVPRRGYRFIARVNEVSQAAGIGLAPTHTRNGSKWLGVIKGQKLGVAVGLIVVGLVNRSSFLFNTQLVFRKSFPSQDYA